MKTYLLQAALCLEQFRTFFAEMVIVPIMTMLKPSRIVLEPPIAVRAAGHICKSAEGMRTLVSDFESRLKYEFASYCGTMSSLMTVAL